ncbi:hypothetical protein [Lyngbya sp. CCY1209]|uniref:hypothetical protein n=1 Tax=Lyngbya sp. CCY1209 TaxID=2886103 RepID=UPI002D206570|nr:hypothetical protein [Lyngbya sp. CCY1209]MEB3886128.1 hypothetical protein [Lyngbya sp. CCY1209]
MTIISAVIVKPKPTPPPIGAIAPTITPIAPQHFHAPRRSTTGAKDSPRSDTQHHRSAIAPPPPPTTSINVH